MLSAVVATHKCPGFTEMLLGIIFLIYDNYQGSVKQKGTNVTSFRSRLYKSLKLKGLTRNRRANE